MENKDKYYKIGMIAFIFAIIAISGTAAKVTTTDFYLNLMNGNVTLLPGGNVSIDTDVLNKTITIDSVGGGVASDDTKVNKSGDTMTGNLVVPMIDISDSTGITTYGYAAGMGNTGNYQTALGYAAGYYNTGSSQTALGLAAGYQNIGVEQTAIGYYAGMGNTGNYQTAIGSYAGYNNIGDTQTALGYGAGYLNTGTYQTALGTFAGRRNAGSNTVLLGYYAGYLNTGNNVVFIGYDAGRDNIKNNYFEVKQNNVNTIPLVTGNFSSGEVNIPGGNLNISKAGKGITLYSPNGSSFCTVVSDLGTLTTTAGICI